MTGLVTVFLIALISVAVLACAGEADLNGGSEPETGVITGIQLQVPAAGSLQNPAWSPDGREVLLTRFRSGYNSGPSDLLVYNLDTGEVRTLVADGSENVNLPGSSWNRVTRQVIFSSSRGLHDEIYIIDVSGSGEEATRVTDRGDRMAYEPSLAPDGKEVVFESHRVDVEENGVITTFSLDGSGNYRTLTPEEDDCRQPNWSPGGVLIVYQALEGGQWDLWLTDRGSGKRRRLTSEPGDETDASFSPDGQRIVYSYDDPDTEAAELFIIPVSGGEPERITFSGGYHGAPSWSPDGSRIAFEAAAEGDPDDSSGTVIRVITLSAGWMTLHRRMEADHLRGF